VTDNRPKILVVDDEVAVRIAGLIRDNFLSCQVLECSTLLSARKALDEHLDDLAAAVLDSAFGRDFQAGCAFYLEMLQVRPDLKERTIFHTAFFGKVNRALPEERLRRDRILAKTFGSPKAIVAKLREILQEGDS